MVLLSEVVERHQGELERIHGAQLLPSHHQALQAMRRCRRQGGDLMVLQCGDCQHRLKVPHSCGHRSCPHCQHHDSQRWIERQQAKLLPVEYFLITFTVPAELRGLIWSRQRQMYDLLLKTAWKTVASFARRDPRLRGVTGAHAVLHTHSRRLEFHPHVHLIVPAGAVHRNRPKKASRAGSQRTWQWKKRGYLFPAANLAKVFRAKWLQAAGNAGLRVNAAIAKDWVVDCKSVGSGQKALVYLGRYLYRGVLPEKDILSDRDGLVTFRIRDNTGAVLIESVAGAEFLWMLLRHVLPKRFRRARDYGLLHGNSQKLLQVVQLLLHVMLPEPRPAQPRPPVYCPLCGGVMEIVAVRVRESSPAPG
jgi:hypothetical protein